MPPPSPPLPPLPPPPPPPLADRAGNAARLDGGGCAWRRAGRGGGVNLLHELVVEAQGGLGIERLGVLLLHAIVLLKGGVGSNVCGLEKQACGETGRRGGQG
jgi:hypothetical protein